VPALRETPEEFASVVDVNLTGSFQMAVAAARHMEHGGSIINVSSVLALTTAGLPQAAYSASKAALLGLTRDLAQQWGSRKGIRVNALCPGFFPSEMTENYPEGYIDAMKDFRVLIKRAGKPEEFAATVVFLAGDGAGYITGATIAIDGGVSVT
jgi:NAD(P)-dependent dehydrogenase (short-subunit alcohol dehydrogenase family)